MRILLTEVTGELGRAVARSLLAAGHDVQGIAQRPHRDLEPGVDFIAAGLDHPVVYRLTERADVVILLPLDGSAGPGPADVVRICDAAARAGVRVVFPSLSLLDPGRWQPAEDLVRTGWAPSLVVRIAAPVGRQADALVCRSVAALLDTAATGPLHVLHIDDLVRFLVTAAATDRTGVVDLATADSTDVVTARQILGAVDPRPRSRGVPAWPRLDPALELTTLRTQWAFDCGWAAADAVADTARGLQGRKMTADGAVTVPGRIPMPIAGVPRAVGARLLCAAPAAADGEFDDRIDRRFPLFVAAETSQPFAPMSLDLHLGGLRAAARSLVHLLDLPAAVAGEWESRLVAVFGHRVYLGASALAAAEPRLPDRLTALSRGLRGAPPKPRTGSGLLTAASNVRSLPRLLSAARMYGRHLESYHHAAEAEYRDAAALRTLRDAALDARIRMLRCRIHEGWLLTAHALLLAEATPAQLDTAARGVDTRAEIGSLARVLRAHPYVQAALNDGDLAAARTAAPMLGKTFDAAVAHIGHRGPGAVELATSVLADRPDTLLAAARRAMAAPSSAEEASGVSAAVGCRRLAYDTTLRFTHQLRLAARELAGRLVTEDKLDAVGDIFYLTVDEALTLPPDARLRVKRRVAERERLQTIRLPEIIEAGWEPVSGLPGAETGDELRGAAVTAGVVDGTVRVVACADDADLKPDEVAVVTAADLEFVAVLGAPGAMITNGDAALVEGTVGPPTVAGIAAATSRLRTGMRVRVDGAAGVVTVLAGHQGLVAQAGR